MKFIVTSLAMFGFASIAAQASARIANFQHIIVIVQENPQVPI